MKRSSYIGIYTCLVLVSILFFSCGWLPSRDAGFTTRFESSEVAETAGIFNSPAGRLTSRNPCLDNDDCVELCDSMLKKFADQNKCYNYSEDEVQNFRDVYNLLTIGSSRRLEEIRPDPLAEFLDFGPELWEDAIIGFERGLKENCTVVENPLDPRDREDCKFDEYYKQEGYWTEGSATTLDWIARNDWVAKLITKYDKEHVIMSALIDILANGGTDQIKNNQRYSDCNSGANSELVHFNLSYLPPVNQKYCYVKCENTFTAECENSCVRVPPADCPQDQECPPEDCTLEKDSNDNYCTPPGSSGNVVCESIECNETSCSVSCERSYIKTCEQIYQMPQTTTENDCSSPDQGYAISCNPTGEAGGIPGTLNCVKPDVSPKPFIDFLHTVIDSSSPDHLKLIDRNQRPHSPIGSPDCFQLDDINDRIGSCLLPFSILANNQDNPECHQRIPASTLPNSVQCFYPLKKLIPSLTLEQQFKAFRADKGNACSLFDNYFVLATKEDNIEAANLGHQIVRTICEFERECIHYFYCTLLDGVKRDNSEKNQAIQEVIDYMESASGISAWQSIPANCPFTFQTVKTPRPEFGYQQIGLNRSNTINENTLPIKSKYNTCLMALEEDDPRITSSSFIYSGLLGGPSSEDHSNISDPGYHCDYF